MNPLEPSREGSIGGISRSNLIDKPRKEARSLYSSRRSQLYFTGGRVEIDHGPSFSELRVASE